jgi:hypothetical protein
MQILIEFFKQGNTHTYLNLRTAQIVIYKISEFCIEKTAYVYLGELWILRCELDVASRLLLLFI